LTFDGGGSSGGGTITAHTHSNLVGDGGALSETVTMMNTSTASAWGILKAIVFGDR